MSREQHAALRAKLAAEVDQVPWQELRSHAQAERVFVVAEALALLDVAVAIAGDATLQVEGWIESGALGRPTSTQRAAWEESPERAFRCVIVAPFVLIQNDS